MIIGVPKEIKSNENRVALTPAGALEFTRRGHAVFIQTTAGVGSGFADKDYIGAGAQILATADEVWAKAEMIMKVKEPIAEEYARCRANQLIFTYFHFASSQDLTKAMIERKSICLAYETVETKDRQLPLLIPMSEVAGRMGHSGRRKISGKTCRWSGCFAGRCSWSTSGQSSDSGRGYCGYTGC
jgi:alanine dehydrogenase